MSDKTTASQPAAEEQLNQTPMENGSPEAPEEMSQVSAKGADEDLLALLDERDKLKDQLLRIMAETENYKKRAERDKAEFLKRANQDLIKDLLPILDNLERALDCAQSDEEPQGDAIVQGLDMIQQEFIKVMEKNGVEPVAAMGQPFDPELHEAMMQQEDPDADENTVLCVYQKGYLHHGRLIRPAQVVVSKKPAAGYTQKNDTSDSGTRGAKINIKIN